MKNKLRFLSVIIMLIFTSTFFISCTSGGSENSSNSSSLSGKATGNGDMKNILVWNQGDELKSADPSLNNEGGFVPRALFEGLLVSNEKGVAVPGCIEEMPEISEDGLTYTFKILKDAKWSDGKDLTAEDFRYSFLRTLNPDTGSSYASELFRFKNGKEYNEGKVSEDEVGIKAIDDKTLELTLVNPVPYLNDLLTFTVFNPVRSDIAKGSSDAWTRDPKTCITNGPFKLVSWTSKDKVSVEKNPYFHNADKVKLDGIDFPIIPEASTSMAAFRNGEIDAAEIVPRTEVEALESEGLCQVIKQFSLFYLSFNLTDKLNSINPEAAKAFADPKVRKALALAINRKAIVENVTKCGEEPALAFVPYGVTMPNGEDYNNKELYKDNDIEEAKKLLAEAGYPNGEGFPTIELLYQNDEIFKSVLEAVQDMWKTNLGVNISLSSVESKVFFDQRKNKDFTMARSTWTGDYLDPNTFIELFTTDNENNNAGYSNAEYDKLVKDAALELDPTKRFEILKEAEEIIMTELPIIPIYFRSVPMVLQPYVKGFYRVPTGSVFFDKIYLEGK